MPESIAKRPLKHGVGPGLRDLKLESPFWGIWGSFYDIPKTIFYLLKGDYIEP